MARCAQNAQNRAKSTVVCRQGSQSLAALQDKQSSVTQEYPSLIQTFFDTHTVDGVFLRDEDRRLYARVSPMMSPGQIVRERIPFRLSSTSFPWRHVVGEYYPQGHVIGENGFMSSGIVVELRRISLTGFRSCTSRSHYRSVSKQITRYPCEASHGHKIEN
ncbi:hypothetical protein Tco_0051898 [Tanacetum coccineum]